jgi:hypothetical protein
MSIIWEKAAQVHLLLQQVFLKWHFNTCSIHKMHHLDYPFFHSNQGKINKREPRTLHLSQWLNLERTLHNKILPFKAIRIMLSPLSPMKASTLKAITWTKSHNHCSKPMNKNTELMIKYHHWRSYSTNLPQITKQLLSHLSSASFKPKKN